MSSKQGAAFARRRSQTGATENALTDMSGATPLGVTIDTVVNPVQTTTYHLKPSNNPISFGTRTRIDTTPTISQNAVTGGTSAKYAVTNLGLLTGGNYGVLLGGAGGDITNGGSISGASRDGVAFSGGGSLSNWKVGTITGARNGATFTGGAGTVANAGRIAGESGQGVLFSAGGDLTNAAYGAIVGYNGVYASGVATVTNAGVINGAGASSDAGVGVVLKAGGVLINRAGGIVAGYKVAVSILGTGTVSNGGTLRTETGKLAAVTLAAGSLTNGKGAAISGGGTGVRFTSAAGRVSNAGTIGGATVGTSSFGVEMDHGGTVANLAGGVIKGWTEGVGFGAFASTLTNAGTILDDAGVGVSFAASGHLNNTGLISGGYGISTDGAASVVVNSGSIRGRVTMALGGSVNNKVGGQIYSGGIYSAGGTTVISNAGSINCNGYAVMIQSGSFTNAAGASVYGGPRAIDIAGAGQVTNSGSISAGQFFGVHLGAGGSLVNHASGVITASREPGAGDIGTGTGAFVGANGSIRNAGTIMGSHYGVYLSAGATLTNLAGGTVASPTKSPGSSYGLVGAATGTVMVLNAGTISDGIRLRGGGTITNLSGGLITYEVAATSLQNDNGATISAYVGARTLTNRGLIRGNVGSTSVNNAAGATITGQVLATTIVNTGKIDNTAGASTEIPQGGTLTNAAGGVISSSFHGTDSEATGVKVTNAGTIVGGSTSAVTSVGVELFMGGAVVNQSGGIISGHTAGVEIGVDAGTVINAGTLSGVDSVDFTGSGANTLILQSGSNLIGASVGSTASGATNALILQGSGKAGNSFQHFTTLKLEGAGTWALNGGATFSGAATIAGGTLEVGDASHKSAKLVVSGALTNNGVIDVNGTADFVGAVRGTGGAVIAAGTLELGSTFTENVTFSGTGGVLQLGKSQTYTGTISGFSLSGGTSLDLRDVGFVSGKTTASFVENGDNTSGVLTVTDGAHNSHLTLTGDFSGETFTAVTDGHGGIAIAAMPTKAAAVLPLLAAMASFGAASGNYTPTADPGRSYQPLLSVTHAGG